MQQNVKMTMKINFSVLEYLINDGWTLHSFMGENLMSNTQRNNIDASYYDAIKLQIAHETEEFGDIMPDFKMIIEEQNLSKYLKNRISY